MAFLENLDRKLTSLGQGAIQKTKEVSDSAKMSAAIRGLENQKNEYFINLGKIFFMNYRDMADEQTKAIIEQIDNANLEIQHLQQEMNKLKGIIYCPNCHAEIPRSSLFCNNCGVKIENLVSEIQAYSEKVCRFCGSMLEEGQNFCSSCGTKVDVLSGDSEVDKEQKIDIEQKSIDELSETIKVCPDCGAEVEEDQRFCIYCGKNL